MTTSNKFWIAVGIIGFITSVSQLLCGGCLWHLFFTACNILVVYMNAVVLPRQYAEIERLKTQYTDLQD